MAPTITRTAIVDDDGTLTTGTVVNNAWKQELYDQIDAVVAAEDVTVTTVPHGGTGVATLAAHGLVVGNGAAAVNVTGTGTAGQILTSNGAAADPTFQNPAGAGVSTVTTTGNITALALPAGSGDLVIYMNNATLATIQGIAAGLSGQHLTIYSIGAGQVDASHQDAAATAANRLINIATSGKTSAAAGVGSFDFRYDATTARWRLKQHEQGAWITRTFAAGNYTASAGTWTVASANRDAFLLKGRTLIFSANAAGAVSGTPVTVKIAIPNGYVSAAVDTAAYYVQGNGAGGSEGGYVTVGVAGTTVNFQRFANTAFATGTVTVNTVVTFEVQ